MKKEIIMPKIGLDMEEGTIATWVKRVGDHIEIDDVVAEIETDKVTTEIRSNLQGTMVELLAEEGDTVEITKPIAWMEVDE